ncbi:MAG TPA: alpha/beta hydrolase [Paraburkholderia sp.]
MKLYKVAIALVAVPVIALAAVLGSAELFAHLRERDVAQRAAPAGSRFVRAADVDMLIQERGPANGQTIVFISGAGAWSSTWLPTMEHLAQAGYRSIAVDLPPFGYTSRPAPNTYDTGNQALRILGMLDTLALSRVILVGHSFGGRATVEALMAEPSRFKAAVLVDVALSIDPQPAEPGLLSSLIELPAVARPVIAATATNPWLTGWFLRKFTSRHDALTVDRIAVYQRPLSVAGTTQAYGYWLDAFINDPGLSRSSRSADYASLTMPIDVIWGATDGVTPVSEGLRLSRLLPDASMSVLPGVGHIPHVEDNAAFNRALEKFLVRLKGAQAS